MPRKKGTVQKIIEDVEEIDTGKKKGLKAIYAERILENEKFCVFNDNLYIEENNLWRRINDTNFARIAYKYLGINTTRAQVNDIYHLFSSYAEDLSYNTNYIAFDKQFVFDMDKLDFSKNAKFDDCYYRIDFPPFMEEIKNPKPIEFIMEIAGNDQAVYDDILQSLATIFMAKKPAGIIWWVGNGANGKSTIAKLVHSIFGEYVADLDIKSLEDGRDAPMLNGRIADIGMESSDAYIQDAKIYKNIGTHEDFYVHKFQKQDMERINGNIAFIFNANKVPVFADKTYGTRRRTILIRFSQTFKDNPGFEDKILADGMIKSRLIAQMIYYARKIKKNGGFQWSEKSASEKSKYDNQSNSAITFVQEMLKSGLIGALNYRSINNYYAEWCAVNGVSELAKSTLRAELDNAGFGAVVQRVGEGKTRRVIVLAGEENTDMEFNGGFMGTAWKNGRPEVVDAGSIGTGGDTIKDNKMEKLNGVL